MLIPGTQAHARFLLQQSQVEELTLVFFGRGALIEPFRIGGHFDVVTAQDPLWRGLVAWVLARRLNAQLNIQVHTDLGAQSLIRHVLAQIVIRHADSVRVVSEKIKEQVEGIYARVPVHIVPIFVDTSRFQNLIHRPHEQKTIVWVGRFEEEKDPLQAVTIFKEVRESGIDAKLIMLGEGSLRQKLVHAGAGLPVDFPGWQDPATYLEVADVVLCTSKHESYGASIVEALAAGIPVVAPDVGVAHEAGALVVPRGELAAAVIKVLQSGARGELQLNLPSHEEWAERWKESLI